MDMLGRGRGRGRALSRGTTHALGQQRGTDFQSELDQEFPCLRVACSRQVSMSREHNVQPFACLTKRFRALLAVAGPRWVLCSGRQADTVPTRSRVRLLIFHVGTWGVFPGGGQTEKNLHQLKNKRHTGDAPSNQSKVAGVFPQ